MQTPDAPEGGAVEDEIRSEACFLHVCDSGGVSIGVFVTQEPGHQVANGTSPEVVPYPALRQSHALGFVAVRAWCGSGSGRGG